MSKQNLAKQVIKYVWSLHESNFLKISEKLGRGENCVANFGIDKTGMRKVMYLKKLVGIKLNPNDKSVFIELLLA